MTRRRRGQSLREGKLWHEDPARLMDVPEVSYNAHVQCTRQSSQVLAWAVPDSWQVAWFHEWVEAPRHSLPACPAEALHLRFAREDPTAIQAEELPNALRPSIDRGRRCRALDVRHLSVIRACCRRPPASGGSMSGHVGLSGGMASPSRADTATAGSEHVEALAAPRSRPDSINRRPSTPGGGLPSLPFGLRPACACASRKAFRSRPAASSP